MSSRRRSFIPWIIGVVVVALIGAVVIALTRSDDSDTGTTAIVETNAVVIVGDPLPEFSSVDAAIGMVAPQASGTGFDGLGVELLADGQPTLVGFFAHWCPVCQGEVDELSTYLNDTGVPDDVRVVAVSTSVQPQEDNYPPSEWFDDEGWPTPILLDDDESSVGVAYGLTGFPFWVVVGADGNVIGRVSGAVGPDQFDALIEVARTGAGA